MQINKFAWQHSFSLSENLKWDYRFFVHCFMCFSSFFEEKTKQEKWKTKEKSQHSNQQNTILRNFEISMPYALVFRLMYFYVGYMNVSLLLWGWWIANGVWWLEKYQLNQYLHLLSLLVHFDIVISKLLPLFENDRHILFPVIY